MPKSQRRKRANHRIVVQGKTTTSVVARIVLRELLFLAEVAAADKTKTSLTEKKVPTTNQGKDARKGMRSSPQTVSITNLRVRVRVSVVAVIVNSSRLKEVAVRTTAIPNATTVTMRTVLTQSLREEATSSRIDAGVSRTPTMTIKDQRGAVVTVETMGTEEAKASVEDNSNAVEKSLNLKGAQAVEAATVTTSCEKSLTEIRSTRQRTLSISKITLIAAMKVHLRASVEEQDPADREVALLEAVVRRTDAVVHTTRGTLLQRRWASMPNPQEGNSDD